VTTYYKKEIMAININKVYKSVLSILNKEQRGYLTPSEYNNLARQAQLELLDKLFYDYNRFLNIEKAGRVNDALADIPTKIQEQIDPFYAQDDITLTNGVGTLPTDIYKVIDITITDETIEVEKIDKNRLPYLKSSPLTKPTKDFPVYYQRAADIIVEPAFTDQSWTLGNLRIKYIKTPADPRWGYTTNSTYGTQTYDSTAFTNQTNTQGSTNFVLHPSQETELIINILAYTGFIIKDPNVVQQAVSLGQGAQMAKQQQ
tara:strand:+ start:50 stop:826 length:777 start_codon:yes stop_codon:yes gene_type:complete